MGEGGENGFIDERGLKRRARIERGLTERALVDAAAERNEPGLRIALTVPNYLAVPELLAGSEMVATLPRSLALLTARHCDLVMLEPPYQYARRGGGSVA